MVRTCDNCGKKIPLFGATYEYKDSKDNILLFCSDCDEKARIKKEKEEKVVKKKLEYERKIAKSKAEYENKKREEIILSKNSCWEYKLINLETTGSKFNATGNRLNEKHIKDFNELGSKGWELISAIPMDSMAARLGVSGTATEWVSFIFKRKL